MPQQAGVASSLDKPREPSAQSVPVRPRLISVDAARGIAISLVVLTHAAIVGLGQASAEKFFWYQTIVSVNLPLFVFVTGFLLFRPLEPAVPGTASAPRPLQPRGLALSRARSLLIPYVTWTIVDCAVDALHSPSGALQRLVQGAVDPRAGGPWFLYVLFECIVIFALLSLVSRSSWWLILSTLAVALVLTVLPPHGSTLLGKDYIQFLLPFMAFGFVYARWRPVWRVPDWALAVAGLAVFAALCALTLIPSAIDAWRGALTWMGLPGFAVDTTSRMLRYVLGLAGCVGLFSLAHVLQGWLARLFAVLGAASLGIYLFHLTFLVLLARVPFMPVVVMAAGAIALSFGVVLLVERWAVTRTLLLGTRSPRLSGGGSWGEG